MEKKEYTFKEISNTSIAADVYYTKDSAKSKSPIGWFIRNLARSL